MNDAPDAAWRRPPSRRVRRIVTLLVAATALSIAGSALWYSYALGGSGDGSPVRVVVREGESARTIASRLAEVGVIRSAFALRLHLRFNGLGADLKPGAYDLRTGLGAKLALAELLEGVPIPVFRFTIPEGETLIEIAQILEDETPLDGQAFLRLARSGQLRWGKQPERVRTLEGLLFPETYVIAQDTTLRETVALLLNQFRSEVATLDLSDAPGGLTPYQVIVAASLVEREARIAADRPKIASVILNRLRIGMRLQIDATIQYILLHRDGEYADIVLFRDLEIDSPYNTYQITGLPPTPIAAPGLDSIRAVLNPSSTKFLYYVACGSKGGHAFGETGADHERNVARCQ